MVILNYMIELESLCSFLHPPAFSFGGDDKKTEAVPFSFGAAPKDDAPAPAFSFGSSTPSGIGEFSTFGNLLQPPWACCKCNCPETPATAPFSFGEKADTPSFTFGGDSKPAEPTTPSNAPIAPAPFSFGAKDDKKADAPPGIRGFFFFLGGGGHPLFCINLHMTIFGSFNVMVWAASARSHC